MACVPVQLKISKISSILAHTIMKFFIWLPGSKMWHAYSWFSEKLSLDDFVHV